MVVLKYILSQMCKISDIREIKKNFNNQYQYSFTTFFILTFYNTKEIKMITTIIMRVLWTLWCWFTQFQERYGWNVFYWKRRRTFTYSKERKVVTTHQYIWWNWNLVLLKISFIMKWVRRNKLVFLIKPMKSSMN